MLVWLWNESHTWYRPVYNTPWIRLRDVRVALSGLSPGRYRCRPFDTWEGTWATEKRIESADASFPPQAAGGWLKESIVTVAEDGTATLDVGALPRDAAFRLERIP